MFPYITFSKIKRHVWGDAYDCLKLIRQLYNRKGRDRHMKDDDLEAIICAIVKEIKDHDKLVMIFNFIKHFR